MILLNARVPACLAGGVGDALSPISVWLRGDRIAAVSQDPTGASLAATGEFGVSDEECIDCRGGIVVPAFSDMHTHLDKGHIWARTPNPDGTFAGALHATGEDRRTHWSAQDVRARMEFSLKAAYAHGTAEIRTHIDTVGPQGSISWPVFAQLREAWDGRIALQGVSLTGIDGVPDDVGPLFDLVTEHGGIVGAVLYPVPSLVPHLRALLEEAERRGLDIDFHSDESLDPSSNCLAAVAAEAERIGFSGQITCGHCCSLMTMSESDADRTLDAVAAQGIAIVSLPLCNMYLQDRQAGRTPRIRGGTLVHEMAARGIAVAIASDNTRDPFYAYGDLDMAEVWREATRILHLDHPVGDWPKAFSATPSMIMGQPVRTVEEGMPADLVVFAGREWTELFASHESGRTVIRRGVPIEAAPPLYSELDTLWTSHP
ncbi:MAG: cytosine deaminase [Pseudomonadota bacterium]